jgi:hypothetical protein
MRRALLLLLICAQAEAAPWSDWAGDYSGKLVWTSCSVPGASTATIAIDAVDGALVVELARAADWLPALSLLEEEDGTLQGRQADLAVTLAHPAANAVDVTIDLESGCRARGRLVRAPSKAGAACDRLVAWARIESRCTKLHAPPLEKKLGKLDRCEARATAVEHELIDAGCAPNPAAAKGVAVCLATVAQAERLERCASAPRENSTILSRVARSYADAAHTATTQGELAKVEQDCAATRRLIDKQLAEYRCL